MIILVAAEYQDVASCQKALARVKSVKKNEASWLPKTDLKLWLWFKFISNVVAAVNGLSEKSIAFQRCAHQVKIDLLLNRHHQGNNNFSIW